MRIIRPISLFNTLTRKVAPVVPLVPGQIKIYTCGPTVYNFAHIGNLRTFLFQDLMKRTLLAAGYQVRHCMNITDVEDKIIRDSQVGLPEGASNEERHTAMKALTDKYTAFFKEDLVAMRILPPDAMPKATDHIKHMKTLIQNLMDKGLAYAREGSVYYRIAGFPPYGCLAHLDREGMQSGASVDVDEYEKDQAQDFVLWKAAKAGEPTWDSDWGKGRPGWHIECSAMGMEHLGDRIDIHTGGVDLIFPHHENEIAQSEGALGHGWVNTWVHGEFLMVEGEKMSKSLGNFYTLRDLVEKDYDPITFRYAIQSNHYRKLLNFSFEGLKAAYNSLKRIRAFRRRMEGDGSASGSGEWKEALDPVQRLEKAREDFWKAMADDLNTPEALAAIFTLINDLNAQDDRIALTAEERATVVGFLEETDSIFAAWPQEQLVPVHVSTGDMSLVHSQIHIWLLAYERAVLDSTYSFKDTPPDPEAFNRRIQILRSLPNHPLELNSPLIEKKFNQFFNRLSELENNGIWSREDIAARISGGWVRDFFQYLEKPLIELISWENKEPLTPRIDALVDLRKAAKIEKNWAEADRIRDELKAMGIVLEDRKDGSVGWRRG